MEARGGMATGDRGVARRAKTGGYGGVALDFATDAPRGSAGSFTKGKRWNMESLSLLRGLKDAARAPRQNGWP